MTNIRHVIAIVATALAGVTGAQRYKNASQALLKPHFRLADSSWLLVRLYSTGAVLECLRL